MKINEILSTAEARIRGLLLGQKALLKAEKRLERGELPQTTQELLALARIVEDVDVIIAALEGAHGDIFTPGAIKMLMQMPGVSENLAQRDDLTHKQIELFRNLLERSLVRALREEERPGIAVVRSWTKGVVTLQENHEEVVGNLIGELISKLRLIVTENINSLASGKGRRKENRGVGKGGCLRMPAEALAKLGKDAIVTFSRELMCYEGLSRKDLDYIYDQAGTWQKATLRYVQHPSAGEHTTYKIATSTLLTPAVADALLDKQEFWKKEKVERILSDEGVPFQRRPSQYSGKPTATKPYAFALEVGWVFGEDAHQAYECLKTLLELQPERAASILGRRRGKLQELTREEVQNLLNVSSKEFRVEVIMALSNKGEQRQEELEEQQEIVEGKTRKNVSPLSPAVRKR